jgi:hypothetical protein
LVLGCLVLGGCVYLRLLEFKHQLADFDHQFTLQTDEGLRLGCVNPVLLAEDFRWLGVVPGQVKTVGSAERWSVRWAKELPPGTTEALLHDLDLELTFAEGQFTRLYLPERYFAFVPKPFFIGLLRSLGQAGVDRGRRLAAVNFTKAEREALTARVTADSLALLLGVPTQTTLEPDRTTLRYHYTPVPPESKNGVIDMSFSFATVSGQLLRLEGRSPVGQLSFNFEDPPIPPLLP